MMFWLDPFWPFASPLSMRFSCASRISRQQRSACSCSSGSESGAIMAAILPACCMARSTRGREMKIPPSSFIDVHLFDRNVGRSEIAYKDLIAGINHSLPSHIHWEALSIGTRKNGSKCPACNTEAKDVCLICEHAPTSRQTQQVCGTQGSHCRSQKGLQQYRRRDPTQVFKLQACTWRL